ncbi:hypothetical protein PRIPAC_82708 [Pristionchus pacificus]|uniref:Uncharacterized protein n=1 Tax=Pristionchus pacificus TaxID=54126 RepID=A0A2A6BHD8_PRIPA|nr:hypothetical protein PRIPAC_82708 [Pristionchus pacificus]|eukprot:PDM65304.1 hypothetical protein PRIPAC_52246 [Pristionchus pacificus]
MQVCDEAGLLPLGYIAEDPPSIYRHAIHGDWRGTAISKWRDIAYMLGCSGIRMVNNPTGQTLDGTFASVEPAYLNSSDLQTFRYSVPALVSRNGITWGQLVPGLVNQFACIFVLLIWSGFYNGNSVVMRRPPRMTYEEMMAGIRGGPLKLVLNELDGYFESTEIDSLFGSQTSVVWTNSTFSSIDLVCGSNKIIGLFYDIIIEQFERSVKGQSCRLTRIEFPLGAKSGVDWLTHSLETGDSFFHVISRAQPRAAMDAINTLLLRVHSQERTESLLARRYLDTNVWVTAARRLSEAVLELSAFVPVPLEAIVIPLAVLVAGLSFSLLVAVIEVMRGYLQGHRSDPSPPPNSPQRNSMRNSEKFETHK